MKTLIRIISFFALCLIFIGFLNQAFDIPAIPAFVTVLLLGSIPTPKGVFKAVVLETWAKYIMERFWKDNKFLQYAFSDDDYVMAGRIVHIPQPGSKPAVVKNRNSFPGTAVRRSDTDVLYSLDEYSSDPTHIPNIDAIHLSYDKQDSVLGDHMQVINETVADDLLIKWAGNATTVKTTGAAIAPITGQTGNRKGFDHKDLKKLMITMNANDVPKQDRYVLIDDNMYEFFYDSLGDTNAKDFSRYADAENGVVGKLHGFNIMTRSSVIAVSSAGAVKALGAALGATDHLASFAWQKNTIARAIGDVKFFENKADALYYGDVYSALIMAGGRVRRSDNKGVYIIAQDNAA